MTNRVLDAVAWKIRKSTRSPGPPRCFARWRARTWVRAFPLANHFFEP